MRYWQSHSYEYSKTPDKTICVPWQLFTDTELSKCRFNTANFSSVDLNPKDTTVVCGMRFNKQEARKLGFVEIDADGVIYAIHTHVNKYVQDLYKGFDGDVHISSWGMRELDDLNPMLRPKLYSLFNDKKFMANVPTFDNALEALNLIVRQCSYQWMLIPVINTHCYTEEIGKARKTALKKLLYENNLPIPVIVSTGPEKEMLTHNVFMCIEDNAGNLQKSSAWIKCLVARGHNRFATMEEVRGADKNSQCYFGQQLMGYAVLLQQLMGGKR